MTASNGRNIRELIDAVPWGRLALAYGFALDAPAILHAQAAHAELDIDFEDWVFSSVVHQGTPYSATAPALWLMRRIIGDDLEHAALAACMDAVAECAEAISYVKDHTPNDTEVADEFAYRNPEGDPPWASVFPAGYVVPASEGNRVHADYFKASSPDIVTLTECVTDWQTTIAACLRNRQHIDAATNAAAAGTMLWRASPGKDALTELVQDRSVPEHQRAAAVFGLSRAGGDVAAFASDPSRSVRFALALSHPDNQSDLETLVDGLSDLPWLTQAFPAGLPGAPWSRIGHAVKTILNRTTVAEANLSLIDALVGVLRRPSGPLGASHEWGPVLVWAFPDRVQTGVVQPAPLPHSVTPLQARLLDALVHNELVWAPSSGNDSLALARVGLPHDRQAIVHLLRPTTTAETTSWWRRLRR